MPDTGANPGVLSRRNLLIGGTLAVASGVAYAREPQVVSPIVNEKTFEAWVPKQFGEWEMTTASGVVLPPPDSLRDRLYDNLVTRVYAGGGQSGVMLLLAYNNSQSGVVQVHRPEICYNVGGFALSDMRSIEFAGLKGPIPAKIFTALGPGRAEQVAYFTRMGSSFPRRWSEQRIAVMRENLLGRIPDGMMMRVSALGDDQGRALVQLGEFTRQFLGAAAPRLQRLLVG